MRGKGSILLNPVYCGGITPAYAGKRFPTQAFMCMSEDHPRLCGEKLKFPSTRSITSGSPPPMRGKGVKAVAVMDDARITPAYAGKSNGLTLDSPPLKDHPRLCGEKLAVQLHRFAVHGSPPPMRGKEYL